ncbi:MAG: hypothetical protein JSR69_19765 [Proteobacteria bacterium]|nr:hypothetical protein [Pseudomonadota bacterium]
MNAPSASQEADKTPFTVSETTHRALGRLLTLKVGNTLSVRLTPLEAHTLALALVAVRDGKSAETELFMSPIASDAIFVAPVGTDGIAVNTPGGAQALDWNTVGQLAAALSPAAVEK